MTHAGFLRHTYVHTKMHMPGSLDLYLEGGTVPVRTGTSAAVDGRQQFRQECPFGSAFRLTSAFQLRSSRGLSQTLEP